MTAIEATLRSIADSLNELGRRWALVGGLAVSARAEPRFTRDVDLAVAVSDDQDAEQLAFALSHRGYSLVGTIEQTRAGRLSTVRLKAPATARAQRGIVVDLLFSSCGIEDQIVAAAERTEVVAGLFLPVATVAHLLAMKVLARDELHRPKDGEDLIALLAEASSADLAEAERALDLITTRGFNRGRDLRGMWKAFRDDHCA